jgi:hypothetical protein
MSKYITITFNADRLTIGEAKSIAGTMRHLLNKAYRLKKKKGEDLAHEFFIEFLKETAHITTDKIEERENA